MDYPVVIHKDVDSDYGVTVPDFPGCFSAGSTMNAALANVVEAIATHVEGLLLDGEPIPGPKKMETHRGDPDYNEFLSGNPLFRAMEAAEGPVGRLQGQ